MKGTVLVAFVACFLTVVGVARQPQAQTANSGACAIGGRITDSGGVEGLSRAEVLLLTDDVIVAQTIAGSDGTYRFQPLGPGTYRVEAAKPAYIRGSFGQVSPFYGGTSIELHQQESLDDVDVRLWRGCVLTGTVYKDGRPAPNVPIAALRTAYTANGPSFERVPALAATRSAYGPTTDDRGFYRLYGLAPGHYLVLASGGSRSETTFAYHLMTQEDWKLAQASPSRTVATPPMPLSRVNAEVASAGLALEDDAPRALPTYYSSAVAASQATPIDVAPEEIRDSVDISIISGRMLSIGGSVIRPPFSKSTLVLLQLLNRDPQAGATAWSSSLPLTDNSFLVRGLPPGEFVVEAETNTGASSGSLLWGETEVSLAGADVLGTSLTLKAPSNLAGVVNTHGLAADVQLDLLPTDAPPGSFRHLLHSTSKNGQFSFPTVLPGRYRIALGTITDPLYGAVIVGGTDVSDVDFDVPAGGLGEPIQVALAQGASVNGQLSVPRSQRVTDFDILIIPVDRKLWFWRSRSIRLVGVQRDGSFSIKNLAPGS